MNNRPRFEALRIIIFSTLAAILYGILHDQVTAHLCVEYFTLAHPPVFATSSPFLLALGWGVIATWWVGLPLGVCLALAARAGPAAKLGWRDVRRSVVTLMVVSGLAALVAGVLGAGMVATGIARVPGDWGTILPPEKHVAFTADAWAHAASYLTGAIGGLVVIIRTVWRRYRRPRSSG